MKLRIGRLFRPRMSTSAQSGGPVLFPELIRYIIEMEETTVYGGYDIEKETFLPFLCTISLVSRAWYEQTRPFVFKSIYLAYGLGINPPDDDNTHSVVPASLRRATANARRRLGQLGIRGRQPNSATTGGSTKSQSFRRLEQLLELIASNPAISGHITHLFLDHIGAELSTIEFNESVGLLLALSKEIRNLSALRLVGAARNYSEHNHGWWWMKDLDDTGRAAIIGLVDRPSLAEIVLEDAMVPASLWMHKTSLKMSTFSTSRSTPIQIHAGNTPSHCDPNNSELASKYPDRSVIPFLASIPSFFSHVTNLTILEAPEIVEDVNRILPTLQHTLSDLMCGVYCTDNVGTGEGHVSLDLSTLGALRKLDVELISWLGSEVETAYPIVFDTLHSVPRSQLDTVIVRFTHACPPLTPEHPPWNVVDFIEQIDKLICDILPQHQSLQTITIGVKLASCEICEKTAFPGSELYSPNLASQICSRGYTKLFTIKPFDGERIVSQTLVFTRERVGSVVSG